MEDSVASIVFLLLECALAVLIELIPSCSNLRGTWYDYGNSIDDYPVNPNVKQQKTPDIQMVKHVMNLIGWPIFLPIAIALAAALLFEGLAFITNHSHQSQIELQPQQSEFSPPDDLIGVQISAAHQYGDTTLSNLFLINAGAVISILTFLGHMYSTDNEARISRATALTKSIVPAIKAFSVGLLFAVALGLFQYCGMIQLVRINTARAPTVLQIVVVDFLTLFCLFCSVLGFVFGSAYSMIAMHRLTQADG